VTFRRLSKRRQRAALVVALIDRLQWGPPVVLGGEYQVARQEGMCVACGSPIQLEDLIVLARYGPTPLNIQTFIHLNCPDYWELLARTVETRDDKIITRVNKIGRRRASGCGHDVEGKPVYLVRRPVGLDQPNHSDWYCEECVTT
jgi:hypothetical protein